MYQPSFGLFDRVTFTSDPIVQSSTKRLMHELLDYDLDINTPFEDWTKSEMFACSRRKDELKNTLSCISTRFGHNLGCCYGCAIRKIGFIVAGVNDCRYEYDLFSLADGTLLPQYGRGTGDGKITDFLGVMRFCHDILVDYESINPVKRRRIDRYNKQDLFRRFALDTFAALHIVSRRGKIGNTRLRKAFADSLNYVEIATLEERIEVVRATSV